MICKFPSSLDRIVSVSLWLSYSLWSQRYLWMCWQNRHKTSEISMRICHRLGSLGSRLCRLLSRWFIGKAFGMDSNGRKRKEAGMSRGTSRALMQSQRKTQMGWNFRDILSWKEGYTLIPCVEQLLDTTWDEPTLFSQSNSQRGLTIKGFLPAALSVAGRKSPSFLKRIVYHSIFLRMCALTLVCIDRIYLKIHNAVSILNRCSFAHLVYPPTKPSLLLFFFSRVYRIERRESVGSFSY